MCEGSMVILKIILALLKQNMQKPLFFNWNSEIGKKKTNNNRSSDRNWNSRRDKQWVEWKS